MAAARPSSLPFYGSVQQQHMQQRFMNSFPPSIMAAKSGDTIASTTPSTDLSYSLATLAEKQRVEIDQYLLMQKECLRAALYQPGIQTAASVLTLLETRASALLITKEKELAKARKRYMELEEFSQRIEKERESWEKLAKMTKAMGTALMTTLNQLREPCFSSSREAIDDGLISYSGLQRTEYGPAGSTVVPRRNLLLLLCKACGSRHSCVLLIPCQHLCTCKPCAALLDACPLCGSPKKDSLGVLVPTT